MSRKPDLFIVGAPKSGTTSLYEYLSSHPDVYMSPVKEPLYFCPDVGPADRRSPMYPDEARYLALFADAGTLKRVGEASTRYLFSRDAPALIRDFQARPFIVAMLRNPVEMTQALHNERVSQGHEPIEDFAAALARNDRGEGHRISGDYVREAMYAEQLERWFAAVGRERVHVIVFDDFARDPAAEFARLLSFLEVDPTYRPASFDARNESHRQRAWVRRIVDSRPGDWIGQIALPALLGERRTHNLVYRFRHSRVNRRPAPRPSLASGLRSQLEDGFRPDVARLGQMLDRDLVGLWFGSS